MLNDKPQLHPTIKIFKLCTGANALARIFRFVTLNHSTMLNDKPQLNPTIKIFKLPRKQNV
jgi:hypothetical protein